jgi:hypothetical protein
MAAKKVEDVDPKVVSAAMKRVAPLLKKLPKDLRLPEAVVKGAALGGVKRVHRTKNSEEDGAPIVFGGDLVIDGSFDVGCVCVVLGDLVVGGTIEALHDENAIVVGGSIEARGINCTDHIHAAGAIKTEVLFVEVAANLSAGKGITADLAILEDKSVKVGGKLTAEEKVVLTYPTAKGLDQLRGLLDKKAFGTVDGDDNLYDYTNLFGVLRKGKPWRAKKR